MNLIDKTEQKLSGFYTYLKKNPKREFSTGLIIYTVLFAMICAGTLVRVINRTGTLLGADGVELYYPLFLDFRRNVIHFFSSIANGEFSYKMMNYNFMFGSDTLTTSAVYYLPFFPVYALSALVPEESVGIFIACSVILLSYLCGITNILMCRHFKADTIWSCLFAPAYVFCGNYFYTTVWNPQFLYMMLVFPIIITGIDKIINDQKSIIYVLGIAYLAISGFVFLVYSLPFVVLFAAVRVYHISKEKYFSRLIKYFLKGTAFTALGIGIASFIFLPVLYCFFNSVRTPGEVTDIIKLFIPSSKYITETLYCYDINRHIGIRPAIIPVIIFCVSSPKVLKRHKFLITASLVVFSLPVIWYGLNGFMYELCRWGFIPSCLFTFIAAFNAPDMFRLRGRSAVMLILSTAFYLIAFPFHLEYVCLGLLFIAAVISSSPKTMNKITSVLSRIKVNLYFIKLKRYIILGTIIISVLALILICEVFILSPYYNIAMGSAYILASLIVLFAVTYFLKNRSATCIVSFIGALLFSASTVTFLVTCRNELNSGKRIVPASFMQNLPSDNYNHNSFSRFSEINSEHENFIYNSSFEFFKEENQTHTEVYSTQESGSDTYDVQLDTALRYDIATTDIFFSTIDCDYINFLTRCGMDRTSLIETVQTGGFANKEAVYSLFGAENMYSSYDETTVYGTVPNTEYTYENTFLYTNKYALPAGVTYDNVISKEQFEKFNPAELPYAMMNTVYLENNNENISENTEMFSKKCSFDIQKIKRDIEKQNTVSYDCKIKINDDISNSFAYIRFLGLSYKSLAGIKENSIHMIVNDKNEFIYPIENENSNLEWKNPRNDYTFSLGFCSEPIRTIEFFTFFDYDDIEIYYIPENVYTGGYERICKETLENVKLNTNTLTGNITVSSDKVLSINLLHNDGWKAYVDGLKTPVYKANELFLGIKLKEGTHDIKLVYRTPWFYEGILTSFISTIILFIVNLKEKHNNLKK